MAQKPKHIAIILDGNGRWATARGKERSAGHEAGAENIVKILRYAQEVGIEVLSLYVFSTENWKRSDQEVGALMRLLIRLFQVYIDEFMQRHVRLRVMGDISRLPFATRQSVQMALKQTENNEGVIVNIGLNYGGRDEIARAARRAIAEGVSVDALDAEAIDSHLDTAGLPPVDLLIRTGGEKRLSNFMLWQLAYTEFYFTDTLWPDFHPEDLDEAIRWFAARNRRFGGV
ncbi:polyprenyl diphosphate synthase [uncultured Murdochiella sp.]|uniref:polyprenyl diphosphate synthase n=1 Tax=uncultured Murdochiella sp. TaxID=1586095 RepID=UPI002806505C|nr:polyprenyl diphosphate synthase [uncultured Murdochiella sp.]